VRIDLAEELFPLRDGPIRLIEATLAAGGSSAGRF
jgi:hypothetical protein